MLDGVGILVVVLPVRCDHCGGVMAITYEPSVGREPFHYAIECVACGRITMRRLPGVLLRVARSRMM